MKTRMMRELRCGFGRRVGKAAVALVLSFCAARCAVTPPVWAATLTRGPYLQLLATESVTIVWNIDTQASCSVAIGPAGGAKTVVVGGTGEVCVMNLVGLSPGTRYAYVPQADGLPLCSESVFRTDEPTVPFTFLVVGDSGTGGSDQMTVRDRMRESSADFILHVGDMSQSDGAADEYDPEFFGPYEDLVRKLVIWPSRGNHDVRTKDGAAWREAFRTPANNPAGIEDYYSFDFGNAHVVVLDSNSDTSPGSAQRAFLDEDLGASTAMWNFVAFHHTIYSSGDKHGSDTGIREDLVPLFDKHGVDIVFMGHDHNYERTTPLRSNGIVESGEGTVYVTSGGGGGSLNDVGVSWFTAYSESVFHFMRLRVAGGSLVLEMVGQDGAVRDLMALAKGPPPRCGDGLVNHPSEQCDGTDDAACPGGCDMECVCPPVCGDGIVNQPTEQCDGSDDEVCLAGCLPECRCAPAPLIVDLKAAADTYIEEGTEAAWDHGALEYFDVDRGPRGIAYLKFDLRGLAARVEAATLRLHCSNSSDDGGTVYPVADSSWLEGTGNKASSKGGQGLKWIEVDTNRDGTVDARDESPYVPDFARPVASLGEVSKGETLEVDVTGAVGGETGVYTLAIASESSDGATYGSRDDSQADHRPLLHLELIPPCAHDGECDDGLSCNGVETCVEGRCEPGVAVDCDDGVSCTADACDEATGACVHTPQHAVCDNGIYCDGSERCEAGVGCVVEPVDCDDGVLCTADACDEATGACAHTPQHALCDNGIYCDGSERCEVGAGCVVEALDCDDGIPCTVDECDEAAGRCVNLPDDARCDDRNVCTIDTCDAAAGCEYSESGICQPILLNLEPAADTYIERGVEGTWNHGASDHLDVDTKPGGITYLKFDLGGPTAKVKVAILRLYCDNASDDGGTVYPVADSSWLEGSGNGIDGSSKGGPGLKWIEVDTNGDGLLDELDESPYVPDFSRPVVSLGPVSKGEAPQVDVTAAFEGGAGVYTLAIASASSDGATYWSRDRSRPDQRPMLHLELEPQVIPAP